PGLQFGPRLAAAVHEPVRQVSGRRHCQKLVPGVIPHAVVCHLTSFADGSSYELILFQPAMLMVPFLICVSVRTTVVPLHGSWIVERLGGPSSPPVTRT